MRESLRALGRGRTVAMTADVPPGPRAGPVKASPRWRPSRAGPWCRSPSPQAASSSCPPGAPSPSTCRSRRLPSSSAIPCMWRRSARRRSKRDAPQSSGRWPR
ncbi:hypothetical protein [Methyloceanibacter superfactus]|uniref:hypothetical protein n=1 Tax=Methyloceanibacter superfactus TaxID=1774969 RepID=UPI001875CF17|nr:hypothetical protein [Methyloceanibacter superfactus]